MLLAKISLVEELVADPREARPRNSPVSPSSHSAFLCLFPCQLNGKCRSNYLPPKARGPFLPAGFCSGSPMRGGGAAVGISYHQLARALALRPARPYRASPLGLLLLLLLHAFPWQLCTMAVALSAVCQESLSYQSTLLYVPSLGIMNAQPYCPTSNACLEQLRQHSILA